MANSYFNWPGNPNRFVPLDTARAEDVNYALDELSSGLDQVEADIGASIKVAITATDQTITAGPVARADKLIAFDLDGNVTVTADTVTSIAVNAAAAEADAATASAQADVATTKAGEASASASSASSSAGTATTQAGIATTQAGIATTQAGIATTKASEAAATASDLNAVLISKVSKSGDTMTGTLNIDRFPPTGDNPRSTFSHSKFEYSGGSPFSTTVYTVDFFNKPSASVPAGRFLMLPRLETTNGAILNGGITADTSAINIGSGQIVKDTSGNIGFGVTPSAWTGTFKALQIGSAGVLYNVTNFTTLGNNFFNDGTSKYLTTNAATYYAQGSGRHEWYTAASGTAGDPTSFGGAKMVLDVSGNLTLCAGTLGYGAGAGGTVTQATSKTTGVTLNKPSGTITMHNAALANGANVTFPLNNTFVTALGTTLVTSIDVGSIAAYGYSITVYTAAGIAYISLTNNTGASMSEAVVINFQVLKGSTT